MQSRSQYRNQGAFTIIELLTVMSIIVILIGLLVPALNKVRRYALTVKQNAQFHSIEAAMDLFLTEFEQYPDSGALDDAGADYCGAMKLCEAMMGQDLMGFHPESRFRLSDIRPGNAGLYNYTPGTPQYQANLEEREETYLPADKVSTYRIRDIYPAAKIATTAFSGTLAEDAFVLCDVYKKVDNLGTTGDPKIGMPVLYYKADQAGKYFDPADPNSAAMAPGVPIKGANNEYIYNETDNIEMMTLGLPWNITAIPPEHALEANFYRFIRNEQISNATGALRPNRPDSYILISAGWDGEYGTRDDVTNFQN